MIITKIISFPFSPAPSTIVLVEIVYVFKCDIFVSGFTGMYKFTLSDHQCHYADFYQSCTGKVLPMSSRSGDLSAKRKGGLLPCKDLPRSKSHKGDGQVRMP